MKRKRLKHLFYSLAFLTMTLVTCHQSPFYENEMNATKRILRDCRAVKINLNAKSNEPQAR